MLRVAAAAGTENIGHSDGRDGFRQVKPTPKPQPPHLPCGVDWAHEIVAALNDHGRYVPDLVDVCNELILFHEAPVNEVVAPVRGRRGTAWSSSVALYRQNLAISS